MKDISYIALMATFIFITIPIWVSYRQHLGISKEIAFSSLRAFIQLTLIGYVITFIFSIEKWYLIILLIFCMVTIARKNCAKRGKKFSNTFTISMIAILGAECTSVSFWLILNIVDFKAQYIIPMSGMIIGSSMTIASLTFERMLNEFELTKELILAKLALGANPRQACQDMIETTIKAALIPIVAVKYQLVILLTSLANSSITAILVSLLLYQEFFKQKMF